VRRLITLPGFLVHFAIGLGVGFVVLMVGFCFAMTMPQYAPLVVVSSGALLSLLKWPVVAGAIAFLVLIPDDSGFHIPLVVPAILGATWLLCRGAWALFRELRQGV
jgi:hypothetical protein